MHHTVLICHYFLFLLFSYMIIASSFFFFFSSRRRHTRSDRDWSSDVCSSDLRAGACVEGVFDPLGDTVSQRIEDALDAGASATPSSQYGKASGYMNRRHYPGPCPPYVREPVSRPAHSPRPPGPAGPQHCTQASAAASVSAPQAASAET